MRGSVKLYNCYVMQNFKKGTILPLILFFASVILIISVLVILDNRSKAKNQNPSQASSESLTDEVGYSEATESVNPEATRSGGTDKGSADWKTYTNTKNGFSIKYPNNWYITTEATTNTPNTPQGKLFILQIASCDSSKQAHCFLKAKENFLEVSRQDKYAESLDNYFKAVTSGKRIYSKKTSTIEDETAIFYSFNSNNDFNLIYRDLLIKHNGNIFRIEFSSNIDPNGVDQKQSVETFNQILSTFKFLD